MAAEAHHGEWSVTATTEVAIGGVGLCGGKRWVEKHLVSNLELGPVDVEAAGPGSSKRMLGCADGGLRDWCWWGGAKFCVQGQVGRDTKKGCEWRGGSCRMGGSVVVVDCGDESLSGEILGGHFGSNGFEGPCQTFHCAGSSVVAGRAQVLVGAVFPEEVFEELGGELWARIAKNPLEGAKLEEKLSNGFHHCWGGWSLQHLNHSKT